MAKNNKKNIGAKVFAFIALIGIIIGIIGTGVLFLFESNSSSGQQIELSEEQLQELIQAQELNASGSLDESTLLDVLDGTEASQDIQIEEIDAEFTEQATEATNNIEGEQ